MHFSISLTEKGIPNVLMDRKNRTAKVDPAMIPSVQDAVQQYESLGGTLTTFSPFGIDPLESNAHLRQMRHDLFFAKYPTFDPFFHGVVNNQDSLFRQGLVYFIQITERLAHV